MRYTAKKDTILTMTKYEKLTVKRLRKVSILKNIQFNEWSTYELADLIDEYEIYYRINKIFENPVSIYEFLYSGIYEEKSVYEELKSDVLKSDVFESKNVKSIKLKKNLIHKE